MPSVVEQTDALASMPRELARRYAAAYDIQVLPFPLPVPPIPVWLMWPLSLNGDAGHRWFIELLRRQRLPGAG